MMLYCKDNKATNKGKYNDNTINSRTKHFRRLCI